MKPETEEWAEKAEGDYKVARREMRAGEPVWDVVCYLAQQCAEKYLKAFLEELNILFRKTHDLVALLNNCKGLLPELDLDVLSKRKELARLSTFGVAARYPGTRADREAATEALQTAQEVRRVVRGALGFPARIHARKRMSRRGGGGNRLSLRGEVCSEWRAAGEPDWDYEDTEKKCLRVNERLRAKGLNPAPRFREAIDAGDWRYVRQWILGCHFPWLNPRE